MGPGFYASNATRNYPLDDAATAVDDQGRTLPAGILVDAAIRFPAALGTRASLAAVTITPRLITVLFVATEDDDTVAFRPLASFSGTLPIIPERPYPLAAMAPGVAGWIVFGGGDLPLYQGRFTTPDQGRLLASLARPYREAPVTSLGKSGLTPLMGDVILSTGQDLTLAVEPAAIQPIPGTSAAFTTDAAIFVRLADSLDRDVFALYAGPCGARPESRNCAKTPIETVGGAIPTCDGDVLLLFSGVTITRLNVGPETGPIPPDAVATGVAIGFDRGLSESCGSRLRPDDDGNLPWLGTDGCDDATIPTTGVIAADCDDAVPMLSALRLAPPASVIADPTIFDDFSALPASRDGLWSPNDDWSAGISATPTVGGYRGDPYALVKVAASPHTTVTRFQPTIPRESVIDRIAMTLVATDGGAGLAVAVQADGAHFRVLWGPDNILAVDRVDATGVPARLAATVTGLTAPRSGEWGVVGAQVTAGPDGGIVVTGRLAALLGAVTEVSATIADPGPLTGVFGLVAEGGVSRFAYFRELAV